MHRCVLRAPVRPSALSCGNRAAEYRNELWRLPSLLYHNLQYRSRQVSDCPHTFAGTVRTGAVP